MLTVTDGKVIDGKIKVQIAPKLEHGNIGKIDALIMHQTGGDSAEGTLASYKTSVYGAHFLIGKDGTIYQTARVTQKCFHVGKIRSRCDSLGSCDSTETSAIQTILKAKDSYSNKVKKIDQHESQKPYPQRYPSNSDSIGIEVVGKQKKGEYENPTAEQNASVRWLVAELLALFSLTTADIYRHPEVSYKQESEAKNVTW